MADPKINTHSERDVAKRYVVGLNENGKSAVLMDGVPNQQELKDWFWRATLWKTRETPADNTIPGDRSLAGGAAREAFPDGMLARVEWVLPDHDPQTAQQVWHEINKGSGGRPQQASEKDKPRSPSMHHTNTLDVMTILSGEIYLLPRRGRAPAETDRHDHRPGRQPRLEQSQQRALPVHRRDDRREPALTKRRWYLQIGDRS